MSEDMVRSAKPSACLPPTGETGGGSDERIADAYNRRCVMAEVLENGRYSIRVDFGKDHEAANQFSDALRALSRSRAATTVVVSREALVEFLNWSACARDRMDHDGKRKWSEARAALLFSTKES